jgi:predicted nucleic acid-binding protein
MILVDTSVWIEHLRAGNDRLKSLLFDEQVFCHPFVIGELACGTLQKREEILTMLKALPEAHLLDHEEVMSFLEARRLYGRGIGWVDAHLLPRRCSRGAPCGPSTSRSGEQRLP